MNENFDKSISQAVKMQLGMIDQRTDISTDKKEVVRKSIETSINSTLEKFSWEKMKPMFIDIYAEVFTAKELNDVITFYESPAGQKFVVKQPELMRVTMQKMQALMAEIMPELQKEIVASIRSPDAAKARNIAQVEKAKGILTLPVICRIAGAMGADGSTDISSGEGFSNLLAALKISDLSELAVDGEAIHIGDMKTKASY
jgi:hypothetical protein